MGTTADKLTYLNTTKGKIKDSINLTGANIGSNDTFRSYAVKLRDGLVEALNDNGDTIYNNFPKSSGSGSSITLNDTLEAPMRNKMFKGNTLQNGTPTPSTPIEIQSVEGIQNVDINDGTDSDSYEVNLEGKNLFDGVVAQGEFNNSGNINTSTTSRNYSVNYIPVKPSTSYVSNLQLNRVVFYDKNKNFISRSTSYNFYTFTTLSNAYYIRFDINSATDTSTLQLELGNQSTSYVPYRSPIKLYNGDYITGTPDNWSIVRNNKEKIFNGSEEGWTLLTTSNLNNYLIDGQINDINYVSNVINYKSNYYKGILNENRYQDNTFFINSNKRIIFTNNSITSVNNWKTNLATNNITVVYSLTTPTTTSITDTYLISQLNALYNAKSYNGQTNISVSGNLPMILEVSALKDEI